MNDDFSIVKNSDLANYAPTGSGNDADRYDPVALMFKERVIQVTGQVNSEMTYHIIAQLKKLEYMDENKPIVLFINSPGGSVIDGLAILDIMRQIQCPIITVGVGMQASMGSILFAGGDERIMMPHAEVLVHQIMGGAQSGTQHSDFEISAQHMARLHETLKSIYVEFTGLNHAFWDIVGERDTALDAEQAIKLGLAHRTSEAKKAGGFYAVDAVRKVEDGLQAAMNKAAMAHIQKMSVDEIIKKINNGNAEGGVYSRYRAQMLMRLSEFPQFWTETKKLEMQNKVTSNDNADKKNSDLNKHALTK